MKLYHGTGARHVPTILREGIKPRGKKSGNWKHSIESNASCVYLTTAYPIYFAGNAVKDDGKEHLAVVEVDTTKLNPFMLLPDEDFLEQVTRNNGPAPLGKSMKYRTRWYRKRLEDFQQWWDKSVEYMGTCCYSGAVPADAITRVAICDHDTHMRLLMHGMDPIISVTNFAICAAKYRNYTAWLFGDPLEKDPMRLHNRELGDIPEELREMIERDRMQEQILIDRSGVSVHDANEYRRSMTG